MIPAPGNTPPSVPIYRPPNPFVRRLKKLHEFLWDRNIEVIGLTVIFLVLEWARMPGWMQLVFGIGLTLGISLLGLIWFGAKWQQSRYTPGTYYFDDQASTIGGWAFSVLFALGSLSLVAKGIWGPHWFLLCLVDVAAAAFALLMCALTLKRAPTPTSTTTPPLPSPRIPFGWSSLFSPALYGRISVRHHLIWTTLMGVVWVVALLFAAKMSGHNIVLSLIGAIVLVSVCFLFYTSGFNKQEFGTVRRTFVGRHDKFFLSLLFFLTVVILYVALWRQWDHTLDFLIVLTGACIVMMLFLRNSARAAFDVGPYAGKYKRRQRVGGGIGMLLAVVFMTFFLSWAPGVLGGRPFEALNPTGITAPGANQSTPSVDIPATEAAQATATAASYPKPQSQFCIRAGSLANCVHQAIGDAKNHLSCSTDKGFSGWIGLEFGYEGADTDMPNLERPVTDAGLDYSEVEAAFSAYVAAYNKDSLVSFNKSDPHYSRSFDQYEQCVS